MCRRQIARARPSEEPIHFKRKRPPSRIGLARWWHYRARLARFAPGDGAVRQAATLVVIAGVIGLLNDAIPGGVGHAKLDSALFDSANLCIGIGAWLLPWPRWSPRASLMLVPLALANIAGSNVAGVLPQPTYGIWFVLVFVGVGTWHPPLTSLALGPLAAVADLPFAVGAPRPSGAVGSVILAIPVAVLVGETIARNAYATRTAQCAQADAMRALAKATVTDDLTGLGNRRHGDVLLDSLAAGDTLAMLDLDHFKGINDALGHPKGDRVLQEFGSFSSKPWATRMP